jgi:hypothetical protein
LRDILDLIFTQDDLLLSAWKEIGEEKASAAMQRDGPERPRKSGRGRSVSIVSLEVLPLKKDRTIQLLQIQGELRSKYELTRTLSEL